MSLRDQLLKKGFASKKDAKRVNRELKKKRKKKQGGRDKRAAVQAREQAAAAEAIEARLQERARGRRLREGERAAIEHQLRVERIVLDSRIRGRGKLRFHFKKLNGRNIDFVSVSHKVALKLRVGEAAIAAVKHDDRPEDYWIIPASKARKLLELEPLLVVFFVQETAGISAPEEAFLEPDWEISLRPHRKA